jgi:putative DNA methylase
MPHRPHVLLESWLPFDKVGAESLRDASAARKPPLNRLHVWWARRPLTISRAAIVASLLPDFGTVAADPGMKDRFPTEADYHAWFLRLMGIFGDPVATRQRLLRARETGENLGPDPYGYPRAFTTNPTPEDLALLEDLLALAWGEEKLNHFTVLDPFAGGGSIPFEARRYGFATVANELNPVAAVILKATLDYPARFGPDLAADIKSWGRIWAKRVRQKLAPFFPKNEGENIFAYLWARTVACPVTGKPVPLSPNWWLSKGKDPVAVRLLTDPAWDEPRFEIVRGDAIDFDPDEGTVSRGVGRSPWTGDAIDGDTIKAEAQAGRMGQMLYAVALKRRGGFDFRPPTAEDLAAVAAAEAELARQRPLWEAQDIIPTEPIPEGLKTPEPMRYGMYTWAGMFSPRQLLALGTFVETLRELRPQMREALGDARPAAVETYLGVMMDKAVIYNNRACRFDPTRGLRSVFDRHDFAFVWSHGEFDASANLLPWAISQIADSYKELAELLAFAPAQLDSAAAERGPLTLLQGSAADLSALPDGAVHTIVTDPPYYDNVMYAELADFFYVWLKRTAGPLYPEWFAAQLTDKDAEAVANPARFADLGRKKKDLAEQDYERKMAAAFREMHRTLRDDGVLTVMFTHKRVEAWDTLATALIGAGFSVESSWPVHTESEHSLHQAKKNAARSTILLCCRKRGQGEGETRGQGEVVPSPPHPLTPSPVWWDDIASQVRQVARDRAAEFNAQGIKGVDLYLSTFGPVLAVISEHWPVLTSQVDERTGEPRPLRPETALDLAREEVIRLRKRGLLLGREVQFDPTTDWVLMAWDAFRAARFPADEARKLALALGLDVESDLVAHRVVGKKGSDVILLPPRQRRARGRVNLEADAFDTWLDAVHTAMLVYDEDGAPACEAFLKRAGLRNDGTFKACLQAMLNAVPRTRIKGKFARPEAEVLDSLRLAFFEELAVPAEEEPEAKVEQLPLDM